MNHRALLRVVCASTCLWKGIDATSLARLAAATPKKKGGHNAFSTNTPGTVGVTLPIEFTLIARNIQLRSTARIQPTPSPHKFGKPPPFMPVRGTSPSKPLNSHAQSQRQRVPSKATFNPVLPPHAPTYPATRAPRRDESMLSVNGSPLANPYTLGLGWFTGGDEGTPSETIPKGKGREKANGVPKTLRRVNSIVIRSDPSVTLANSRRGSPQSHSLTNSQSTAPTHSRNNSRTQLHPESSTAATPPKSNPVPLPLAAVPSSSASALVSLPIKDGHLLEFDPLTTSPSALDALVGISDSAKKHAREEMARLVKEAVRKWVIE